jgi:CRISPR-associated protein Csm5
MDKLHTEWAVEVETLSPFHIGSGTDLMLGYDLVPHRGRTYRVDEQVLLDAMLMRAEAEGAAAVNQMLVGRPASELLERDDFDNPDFFHYTLVGTPDKDEGKIPEQLKDVYGRPYLPGSSLKGALRTLLAWGIYTRSDSKPDLNKLERRAKFAARGLEKELFGRDPNRDFLRALQVQDSAPLEDENALNLQQVQVYPGGTPIEVEAVRAGMVFRLAVAVDEYGFQGRPARRLGWEDKRAWLGYLTVLGKEYARERLLTEVEFFKERGGPQATLGFYAALVKQILEGELDENEFLLQVGWGTGWESKTLGSGLIRQDDAAFERLLNKYRMTKERNREVGDPFPKSRTLALRGSDPSLPLGWVRVKFVGFEPGEEPKIASQKQAIPAATPLPPGERPTRPQDLQPGQVLEGTVRGVVDFGAFVDIGVGRDGLVHISELAEERVPDVGSVVRFGQRVRVKVLNVEQRGSDWRIGLTMKGVPQP